MYNLYLEQIFAIFVSKTKKLTLSVKSFSNTKKCRGISRIEKKMISENKSLCCEFDFGQNLSLPKIAVSEQFYRRLIWLHIFNVHFYNSKSDSEKSSDHSYMIPFMEGAFKIGANKVCNLLLYVIKEETKIDCCNKIYFCRIHAEGKTKIMR